MENEEIVGLFMACSQQAIVETERKYGEMCKSIVRSILSNKEDQEECLDDIYMELWKSVSIVRPTNLKAYIACVAKHQALKKKRYNNAECRNQINIIWGQDENELSCKNDVIEERLAEMEMERYITKFLERYDERKRNIFIRRYSYGDSLQQISENNGLSINNVKVMLFRMRRELKKYMDEEGLD